MDNVGQGQKQLVEILIKLAGSLTEEDLMDPATFGLASQLVQMMEPKADPMPQELIDKLKEIKNKATRFKMAAQALGASRPDLMDKLVDSMKAAGLWKSEKPSLTKVFFYAQRKSSYYPPKSAKDVKSVTAKGSLYTDNKDGYLLSGDDTVHGETMMVDNHELSHIDKEEGEAGWKRGQIETSDGPAVAYFYSRKVPKDANKTDRWDSDDLARKTHHAPVFQQMDYRKRNVQFAHHDKQLEEKELNKANPPVATPTYNEHIRSVAESYAQPRGIQLQHDIPKVKVNPEFAGKVATAYHGLEHSPAHPQTKAAYDALIDETTQQLHHLQRNGYKFTPIKPGQANPYASGSAALAADLRDNKHAHYYPTEQGFGSGDAMHPDHPMLRTVKDIDGNEMPANDAFRIVHDVFGHAKEGHSFGPNGEENAYRHHYQMFSPLARRALTAETRGQNSWVNFGPHAAHNRANPEKTVFAEQKAGLLPEWAEHHYTDEIKKSVINFQKPKQNDGIFDIDRHLPSSNQSVEAKKDFTVRSHTPSGHPVSYDSDVFSEKRAEQTHKDMTAEDHAWASHHHETKSASLGNSDKGRVHRMYGDWHTKKAKEKDPSIQDIKHYGGPNFNLLNAPDIRRKLTKSEELDKGINGDWEKEGYTFRTSRSKKAGHTVKAYKGKTRVGHMAFSDAPDSKDGYHHVYAAHISDDHRGKGLYQEMIRQGVKHAQSLGSKGLKTDGFQRSGDATRAWEKINPEVRETNPHLVGGKRFTMFADERHLNKAEDLKKPYVSESQRRWAHTDAGRKALGGDEAVKEWDKESKGMKLPEKVSNLKKDDHYLEHYSAKDTKFDTLDPNFHGTGVSGDERKRLGRPNRTYYYDKGTANEPRVTGPAKFKYIVKAPSKILDLNSKEAKPHLDASKTSAGIVDHTELEHNIKNAGYDGYRHSGSSLPNVVALFHPQKPVEIHDLSSTKKSEDLETISKSIQSFIKEIASMEDVMSNKKEALLKKAEAVVDRLRKFGKDKEADILDSALQKGRKTEGPSYNIVHVPGNSGEHHIFADDLTQYDENNHFKNVGYMHIVGNKVSHVNIDPGHRNKGLAVKMYNKAKKIIGENLEKSDVETMAVYEDLTKSKNIKEQRSKVFGGWKTSPDSPRRAKQMAALEEQGKRRYGLDTERAPGKKNAHGKMIDKPTFDNPGNKIQHIGNPDSLAHEHAHLEVEKQGSGLKQLQADMDHEWGAQSKKFGYKQQARAKDEYSTTALENPLRRRAGLPPHQKETKEKNPKRDYAADVPGKKITQETPEGKRLTGTSSNRTPEHNRRMDQVDRGELKFHPDHGWQPGTSANSKINQRAREIAENPANSGRKDAKTLMRGEDGSKPLSFNEMKKSDLAKSWEIKLKGQEGYHPVKDVVDQGPGKQNAYVLHDGSRIDHEKIEDLRIGGKNVKDTPRATGPTSLKPSKQ